MTHLNVVLTLVCAAVASVASAQSPTPPTDELAEEIQRTTFGLGCEAAIPKIVELVSRPDFPDVIDRRQQSGILTHLAMCMDATGRVAESFEYVNRAAAVDPDSFAAQGARMTLGMEVGRPADTVDAVEALARIRPAIVRGMTPGYADKIVEAAEEFDGTGALTLRFHDALERVAWAPPRPYSDDSWRVEHARLLLEHDRPEDARQRLASVTDPEYVVAIRSDRTFDALRKDPGFEMQLAFATAIPESLARAAVSMEQAPNVLAAVTNYVDLLEDATRFDEVLATTEAAINRHESDPATFGDASGNMNWLINQRVHALYSLGRFDEGRSLARQSVELPGVGRAADGNLLNYASQLLWEGRSQEALALLLRVESSTAPFRTWVESIRSCAAVQLGESATLKASLDYLRVQEAENTAALSTALLCANELDEAAALMIRRLGSRTDRQRALAVLQIRPLTRYDGLPARKQVHDGLQKLRERGDVREAIKAIGRIETVPVIVTKSF
jgi:tetratricopeptide (TPR) repeat protein